MSVLVAAIGGITATVLGAFWLAHKIVEATLEDEARAEAREPMIRPKRGQPGPLQQRSGKSWKPSTL